MGFKEVQVRRQTFLLIGSVYSSWALPSCVLVEVRMWAGVGVGGVGEPRVDQDAGDVNPVLEELRIQTERRFHKHVLWHVPVVLTDLYTLTEFI